MVQVPWPKNRIQDPQDPTANWNLKIQDLQDSRQNKSSKVQDPQVTTAKWNIKIQDLQDLTAKQILKVQDPQDTTVKWNIKIEDLQDLTAKQVQGPRSTGYHGKMKYQDRRSAGSHGKTNPWSKIYMIPWQNKALRSKIHRIPRQKFSKIHRIPRQSKTFIVKLKSIGFHGKQSKSSRHPTAMTKTKLPVTRSSIN